MYLISSFIKFNFFLRNVKIFFEEADFCSKIEVLTH